METTNWKDAGTGYDDLDEWIENAWGEEFARGTALMQRLKEERYTSYTKILHQLAERQHYTIDTQAPYPTLPTNPTEYAITF